MAGARTNKSYSKRLKITKNGKILAKKAGINHFNAKKNRGKQLLQKRWKPFVLTNKSKSVFLPK